MRKIILSLVLLWFCDLTIDAQIIPPDSIAAVKARSIAIPPNKRTTTHAKISKASIVERPAANIVMEFCDDDQDGFLSLNIDSINNEVLLQNGNTSVGEGILISTLNSQIIRVNDLSNHPYITTVCTGLPYMADIAVNQAGDIFVCGFQNVLSVDPACNSTLVFSYTATGSINALSFDRHDNLYFGGGSSKAYRCDAGTFNPVLWHDFVTGFSGGDFVMLDDKMYIAWVQSGSYRLYEVIVDANMNYVSHVDLGQLPGGTYGLASEYGKLYGVTTGLLYRIILDGAGGFTTDDVLYNTTGNQWGGAAGLHEAVAFDVKAFETLADAQTLQNELPGRWTNTVAGGQRIYVAIINIITHVKVIVPVDIIVHVTPVNAGPDQLTCKSTVTMGANTPTGSGSWTLVSGAGIITNPSDPATTITSLQPGDNVFRWTVNNNTCLASDVVTIRIDPTIVPAFASLAPICAGTTAPVLPPTSLNGITGTWSPATVSNTTTGIYTFTPNEPWCLTTTTLTQIVNSSTASFDELPPICNGDIPPVLPGLSREGIPGTWQPALIDNTRTATYTFTPAAGSCALNPVSITQQVNPKPPAFAGNDSLAAIGLPHQLQASGGVIYEWTPGTAILDDPFIANPKAILREPTRFFVKVTDDKGCSSVDDVFIKLYDGITYYVPNAFTPNGDGLNDLLKAIPAGVSSTSYFNIYNRWGQLVFSTSDLTVGWDGTYKSKRQSPGAYMWMIKGVTNRGFVIEMKGTVQLIR